MLSISTPNAAKYPKYPQCTDRGEINCICAMELTAD